MQTVNERVRGMRWTAYTVGASFLSMLFVLISLGVPWFKDGERYETMLFTVVRNSGFAKKAGDPAFALLFIGGIFQLIGLHSLYIRWAGRSSRIPHSAMACVILFGFTALFNMLAFAVYAGKISKDHSVSSDNNYGGHYGPGFGIATYLFVANTLSTWGLFKAKDEVENAATKLEEPPAMQYAEPPAAGKHPLHPSEFRSRWGKTKVHSTVVGLAVINLLFLIMALGLPWWQIDGFYVTVGTSSVSVPEQFYGLMQTFTRLSKSSVFRKAGDPAFAFTFFAFLAQIHSTFAVTLRFLGRDDKFAGRIPHSLQACLASTGISCFCSFLAWVIYAGVYNSKKPAGSKGMFFGGFGLVLVVWLLTASVIAILILKKSEVDNAPARTAIDSLPPSAFPIVGNPLVGAQAPPPPFAYSAPAPHPGAFMPAPGAPQTLYAVNPHPYAQDYPPQPSYGDNPVMDAQPQYEPTKFDGAV